MEKIKERLLGKIEGVVAVHEFHVWQLAGNRIIASGDIRHDDKQMTSRCVKTDASGNIRCDDKRTCTRMDFSFDIRGDDKQMCEDGCPR